MKKGIFSKWYWHNWISTSKSMKIEPYLSPDTKLKLKWIKDNIKPAALNLIEKKGVHLNALAQQTTS